MSVEDERVVLYTCSLVGLLDLAARLPWVVRDVSSCLCPSSEVPWGANCSTKPQKGTLPDPGTDVQPRYRVAL